MERFGLSDKSKEELIDIILRKNSSEKSMSAELSSAKSRLAQVKLELTNREKAICYLCVICIILMASSAILLFCR